MSFLNSIHPKKTIAEASPYDVRKFHVYKDENGKTTDHNNDCLHKEKNQTDASDCPLMRLAGSGTEWNDKLCRKSCCVDHN